MAQPVLASRFFNADTGMWEVQTSTPSGRRGSAIKRETVDYATRFKPGTIIVETGERRLYFVLPNGKALKYGIGVGRDGFRWSGAQHHAQGRVAGLDAAGPDAPACS